MTGATRGLGREMAGWLAAEGARVVICSRRANDVERSLAELRAGGGKAIGAACDVSEDRDVDALVAAASEAFGPIEVVIANAAVLGPVGRIERSDPAGWRRTLDVNVVGVANLTRAVVPAMRDRGWGRIVTLSGGGLGGARLAEHTSAYVASKAAVVVLTEVLAAELAGSGVTVNAIAPGPVPTTFMQEVLEVGAAVAGAALFESVASMPPADLEPLRHLLRFVLSDDASWLTGRCLSARWDDPDDVRAHAADVVGSSRFRLRRIDETLFGEIR